MGRAGGLRRDNKYVNNTMNMRYDHREGKSTLQARSADSGNIIYVNGVPMEREKMSRDEYTDGFMRIMANIYFMYFTKMGRSVRKKAKDMAKLEKEVQDAKHVEVEVTDNA